jgi:hypothetical protein
METVTNVTLDLTAGGIYTAVTEREYLVVDGIVASPFALAHGIAHSFFDRADINEWCKDNHRLVPAAKDKEIQNMVSRRRLLGSDGSDGSDATAATSRCLELMETLFENYKDEGVGWGANGFGYRNFRTIRGSPVGRLSG